MCSQKILLLKFRFPFYSLLLFFTLLAASISPFLTTATKCSYYSSNKIHLLYFLPLTLVLCRSFSRWALLACCLLSCFLFLYIPNFVDMTININLGLTLYFLPLTLVLCRSFSRWALLACCLLSCFLFLYIPNFVDMTININLGLTLSTLRSKFEFSFVAPIHFLQK